MKQHIDTAPVWEVYRQDCECPVCLLHARVEAGDVDYFLGESVMEPSQRIEVNKKGFCDRHFKMMYDVGNRLGLALMTQTYMKQTLKALKDNAQRARHAGAEGGLSIFRRRKGGGLADAAGEIRSITGSCALCERLRVSMERYIYTIIYMYLHEPEFPALLAASKGMCLEHYAQTLEMAEQQLSGDKLKSFVETLTEIELKSFDRLTGEVDWFIRKFDYRNADEPWGNSRDAVKRSVNKLCHQIVED